MITSKIVHSALGVIAAASLIPVAVAEPVEEKHIEKGKKTIEADSGYIYLEAPTRFAGMFVRVPDEADYEQYLADLDEAIEKARKKHAKQVSRYEASLEQKRRRGGPLENPGEFDPASVSIGDLETRTIESFGPMNVYLKDKSGEQDRYSYLTKVPPGTYIWYGTVVFDTNSGWTGQCMCMGTVQFEVAAGEITDLGNSLLALPDYAGQATADALPIVVSGAWTGTTLKEPDGSASLRYGLPETLSDFPVRQAELRAAGKMNNFYGVMISRLAPIEGVLSYERDKVIDMRTGEAVDVAVLPQ